MAREAQHIWGPESRRDGNGEWPSTSFSTFIDEPRESRPPTIYRRHRKSSYIRLALPFLLVLCLSFVGVLSLARHFQG